MEKTRGGKNDNRQAQRCGNVKSHSTVHNTLNSAFQMDATAFRIKDVIMGIRSQRTSTLTIHSNMPRALNDKSSTIIGHVILQRYSKERECKCYLDNTSPVTHKGRIGGL